MKNIEYILKDVFKETEEHFSCNDFTLSKIMQTLWNERYSDNYATDKTRKKAGKDEERN